MKRQRWYVAGFVAAALISACARTNAGLTSQIKTKLAADPVVQAHEINVDSNNGVVTLRGNVDTQEAKDRAIQIARETKGVVSVTDMISVQVSAAEGDAPDTDRTIGQTIDDAGITMRVKQRLFEDPTVKGLKIDVDTREGVVYLTGTVANETAKDAAIRLARETEGVRDVQANIEITTG